MRHLTIVVVVLAGCGGDKGADLCAPLGASKDGTPREAVGTVGRCKVSTSSFRLAFNLTHGSSVERKEAALDLLIQRELLAQGAREAGIAPLSTDSIDEQIKVGDVLLFGIEVPRDTFVDPEDGFDFERFRSFCARFDLAVDDMRVEQRRERLAAAMRDKLGPDVDRWVGERCRDLAGKDQIVLRAELLVDQDETGADVPSPWKPCAAFAP